MISGASVPVFLACLLGMLLFYRYLNILPETGQTSAYDAPTGPTHFLLIDSLLAGRPELFIDDLYHLILPAFCLALIQVFAIPVHLRIHDRRAVPLNVVLLLLALVVAVLRLRTL